MPPMQLKQNGRRNGCDETLSPRAQALKMMRDNQSGTKILNPILCIQIKTNKIIIGLQRRLIFNTLTDYRC